MVRTILTVSVLLAVSCGGPGLGVVGDPCGADSDCEGFCLFELEGEWLGEQQYITFPGGMCTDNCDVPGDWSGDFDICLMYAPTEENFLFPSCRNQLDCRSDEGYTCLVVGYDANLQPAKACLPPGV